MTQDDCKGDALLFVRGGGEMGALIRAHEWNSTSLGNPRDWPQGLRTAVRLMLNTGHPMYIFWGAEGACLYNDAYRLLIGPERHPSSLGKPARAVWEEIWPIIGPQIEHVMSGLGATWDVNALIPITRNGVREDVYWTYSYGPIDDDAAPGGIGGVLVVCTETTEQIEGAKRLAESEERLSFALSAGRGIGTWMWDVPKNLVFADERFARLYGVPVEQARAGAAIEEFFKAMHPDDVGRVGIRINEALQTGDLFSEEYRLLREDGSQCWVLAEGRAELSAEGVPLRFPGVSYDISDRRRVEDQRDLLLRELDHRVKNLFSIMSGIVSLSARTAGSTGELKAAIMGRLLALANAHSLIQPLASNAGGQGTTRLLRRLVEVVMAPHLRGHIDGFTGVSLDGPDVVLGGAATTSLSLVFHELATNAAKYGALSTHEGAVTVRWVVENGELAITWVETGGPALAPAPRAGGFGSILAERSIVGQLKGELEFDWCAAGLIVTITIPMQRLED